MTQTARRFRGYLLWAAILALVIGGGAIAYAVLSRPTVTVTDLVEGPVVQAFYSTGTVEPLREYPIKSNIAGVVTEVLVDKGDKVKKGDKLAFVSDPLTLYQFQKAEAELNEKLARAEAKSSPVLAELDAKIAATGDLLKIAQKDQERYEGLVGKNAVSQSDVDRSIDRARTLWSEYESYKSQRAMKELELFREVQVARAALQTAKWNVDQQTLVSPIDGVVLDRPVTLGTRLAINDHLMQVADVRPANLVMRAAVDEEDKNGVYMNQTVRMTLYSFAGQIFAGKVTRIYDQADADRRTFEVEVTVDQITEQFSPGMTGELAFILSAKDKALVAPAQALQAGQIYTVRNGKLENANAKVGLQSVERIEIVEGLQAGDKVVISPATTIAPGTSVKTKFLDPKVAAGLNKGAPTEGSFKGLTK